MPKQRLTPWFRGDKKPSRIGLYQVIRRLTSDYPSESELYWDGCIWLHTKHSSKNLFSGSYAAMCAFDKWRGLAEEPKEKP